MKDLELNNFYNRGFGWICKNCECVRADQPVKTPVNRSRILTEGESEDKSPHLTTSSLAKWADDSRNRLVCPVCKRAESVGDGEENDPSKSGRRFS